MKPILFFLFLFGLQVLADTPPPGTVKAKMYTGDGVTALTSTGTALNVNVTNSGGLSTVNQGNAGVQSWLAQVTSSALPSNACQETGGHLASIDSKLTAPLAVTGTFWQATQPVSLASLPVLPTGTNTIGAVNVNGTIPVSGSITANAGTNLNTSALALESGGNLESLDTKTPALGQALAAGSVPVVLTASQLSTLTPYSSVTVSGTVTANAGTGTFTVDGSGYTQPVSGTFWQATQPISAAALPLPSGAATAAKQPALGVAGTASSDVLTVQGIASMTALKTDGSGVTQPVSGTVTANAGTGTFTVNGSGFTQPVSGTFWQATQPVSGTFWQATQPVSGTVTANAGSGTFTVDASGFTVPVSGTFWPVTQPVSGTFWQATQPVSGTFWQATQPVSLSTLPALTAGSAVIGHVIVDTAPTTAVTQSGTWTVQPGNTANTTAWLVNAQPKTPAAVTVKQAAVTIGTSAVRLTEDGAAPSSTRVLLVVQLLSTSTANCYFGSSGVTSSGAGRGVQMFAGQPFSFNNDAGDYYAICDTVTQTFLITEQE